MLRFFLIPVFLIFIHDHLLAQLFNEKVLNTNDLLTRKTEAESFTLDENGYAHFVMNCPTDTSVNFYYVHNINDNKAFGNPIFIRSEKFAQNEAVFLHFFSLLTSRSGLVFYFYMKEYVLHDENLNQLEKLYQIKCLVISPKGFLHEVIIYETSEHILHSKYTIDQDEGFHVAFILQTDFFDPESPKTINYVHNTTGTFSDPIDVSGPVEQLSLHHFQFQLDENSTPHFFSTNFEGDPMKNYLNHWYSDGSKYNVRKIDSVNLEDEHPWFESFITSRDHSGSINLLYLSDSLYHAKLLSNGEIVKVGIHSYDDYLPSEILDFEAGEFMSFAPIYTSGGNSYYYLWELESTDTFYAFETSLNPLGFQFDMDGYLHGIGLSGRQENLFGEIVYLKSKFPLNPFPVLPPASPLVEDKVFCLEDEKLIIYDGSHITWHDNDLNNIVGSGDTLDLSYLKSGLHRFLVTETILSYSSEPDTFYVTVNLPEVDLANDISIAYLDSITISVDSHFTKYNWNTGSDSSSTMIIGSQMETEEMQVTVIVENQHGCISEDTIVVTIEKPLLLEPESFDDLKIYPNPSKGYVVIDMSKLNLSDKAEISLCNATGNRLFNSTVDRAQFFIDLKPYKSNLLILKIEDEKRFISSKIMVN